VALSARRPAAILALALLVIILEPLLFAGSFAGDAQVHLVFAESAARGHFFEFNPGQHVSGETSPGYMLLGAALFRCLPARWVPVALKLLGLLGWYLLCWLVYRVAQRVLAEDDDQERFWPAAAAVTAALIPGSVYNANVGMENGLFAVVVWLWIELGARWRWFERGSSETRSPPGALRQEAALAGLQGLACWLRPEGFVVLGLAHLLRWRRARPPASLALSGLALASALGLASVAFQLVSTGDLVATSILSRRVLAMQRSLPFGPLLIDPAFAERLLLYLPLTVFAAIGARVRAPERTGLDAFLLTLFAAFFVVYTFGAGAAHLARYVIFVMPIVALYAVRGAREVWRQRRSRRSLVALGALAFVVTSVGEVTYRRSQYSLGLLAKAMSAPGERRARTDDLLRRLEARPGGPPLVLALESVQLRYELDDRIVVRSLDGRVDRELFGFVHGGTVDHFGYLRALGVDALVGTADYNRRDREGSLVALGSLRPGQTVARGGLLFRRLPFLLGFSISRLGAPDHER
jgi:hypothetical protein